MKKKKKVLLRIGVILLILFSVLLFWSKNVYYRYEADNFGNYLSKELVERYHGVSGKGSMLNRSVHPEYYEVEKTVVIFEFRLTNQEFRQLKADAEKENPVHLKRFKTCYEWTTICK